MNITANTERPPFPPLAALLVAILAVSTASIFIRFAQQDVPSLVIAAYRLIIASLILAPFAIINQRVEISTINRKQALLFLTSGLFLAAHFASWISSLEYTTVTSSVVLVNTLPLWVSLAAPIFLKENIPSQVWAGLAAALVGGTVVGISQSCQIQSELLNCSGLAAALEGKALTGNLLALFGAWTVAGYMVIGRRLRQSFSLVTYTFLVYTTAGVLLLTASVAAGLRLTGFAPVNYVWFIALAVIPQLMGHSTYNWALRYLSAPYVAVSLLGEPIGSSLLAIFFLHEIPSPLEIIGSGFILAGIIIVSRAEQSRPDHPPIAIPPEPR